LLSPPRAVQHNLLCDAATVGGLSREKLVSSEPASPFSSTIPVIAPEAAFDFLDFLAQRQIGAFLFTSNGHTSISLMRVSAAEAQRLLSQWHTLHDKPTH